jgi:hypothetical protein
LLHIKRLLFREERRGGYDRVIFRAKVWRRLKGPKREIFVAGIFAQI